MISVRPVKNIVTIVCFVPMVCRVLKMTSVSDCVNIFEEYWKQDLLPDAIPSKWFSSDSCGFRNIAVNASI
jgi:hypothetical protein